MADCRLEVLNILTEYESSSLFLSDLIRAVQEKYAYFDERDRAFIKNLATGTVEKQIALDHVLDTVSSVKTAKMKGVIRNILRMAVFEIMYMDHIPARASVNEAVRLTKKKHLSGLSGFVNAVARKTAALYENGEIIFPDNRIRYSCPEFIYDLLFKGYGCETTERIIKAADERSGLYLRVNTGKTDREGLIKALASEGIKTQIEDRSSFAVKVTDFIPSASKAFNEGLCSVQDLSSMLAVEAAGIRSGMEIIDLCASPGGKTCFVSELLQGTGSIRAFDISEEKIFRIDENVMRLGLSNVKTAVSSAEDYDEDLKESADIVIADLPCTGLGVMGRKVDIKYRISGEDIKTLSALQKKMLDNAVRYVKKGGRLLFSTCTLTHEETDMQAEYIEGKEGLKKISERRFIQGIDDCDGFYYAVFEKE